MFFMKNKNTHIIIISIIIFSILNIIENLIHYNIGRSHSNTFNINIPTKMEFLNIISIMLFFGLLQGIFTEYFSEKDL